MHVGKAKSRAVTHEAAQKYDVTSFKIAVVHFENFCSNLIPHGGLYIIKQYQCIREMNDMGLYLTAFEKMEIFVYGGLLRS